VQAAEGRGPVESPWLGRFVKLVLGVVIVGTAISLMAPSRIGGPRNWDASLPLAARERMRHLAEAIDAYRRAHGSLPESLHALTESTDGAGWCWIDAVPHDPWGNALGYRLMEDGTWLLRSVGEDGLPDTEDDVVWPDGAPR